MNEYTYIIFDHNGRRLGKIEFGVRNSVPSAKEIQEAIRDGFPNGTTYKLLVPTKFSGKEDCCKEFCEATKKHDRTN